MHITSCKLIPWSPFIRWFVVSFALSGIAVSIVGCTKNKYGGDTERPETSAIEKAIPELLPLMLEFLLAREKGNEILSNESWDKLEQAFKAAKERPIDFKAEIVKVTKEGFQVSHPAYHFRDRSRPYGSSPSLKLDISFKNPEFISADQTRLRQMRSGDVVNLKGTLQPKLAPPRTVYDFELEISQISLAE